MKISQDTARQMAIDMTQPMADNIDKQEAALSAYITQIALSTIPKHVREFAEKNKKYMCETSYVWVKGEGMKRSITITFTNSLPYPSGALQLNKARAAKVKRMLDVIASLNAARNKKKDEIRYALGKLGTYAAIRKEFPEAAPFLPEKQKTAAPAPPAPDITELRRSVKKLHTSNKAKTA